MGAWLSWQVAQGLIRGALMSVGTSALVAPGYLGPADLDKGVGALLIIIGLAWSAIANKTAATDKAVVKAVVEHPSITVTDQDTTKPIVKVNDLPPPSLTGTGQ